jgi:hypothetical protein
MAKAEPKRKNKRSQDSQTSLLVKTPLTSASTLATSEAELGTCGSYEDGKAAFTWILDVPDRGTAVAEVFKIYRKWVMDADSGTSRPDEFEWVWRLIQLYRSIKGQNLETRDAVREEHQAKIIATMRADEKMAPLVELYDAANAPIASGDPPLTREIANCYLDFVTFKHAIAANTEWNPLSTEARAHYTQILATQYPSLPQQYREWLASLPRCWTNFRSFWRNGSAETRQQVRQEILTMPSKAGLDIPLFAQAFTPSTAYASQTSHRRQPTPSAAPPPDARIAKSHADETLTDCLAPTNEIISRGAQKEAEAARLGPEKAMQVHIANQDLYIQTLTRMAQSRYGALMGTARGLRI